MMKLLLAASLAGLAPSLWAQGPAACRASWVGQELRAGSAAELLGDVLVQCSGGAAGRLDVLILSDGPFANRDVSPEIDPLWGLTDSLMLIGDPPVDRQKPCVLTSANATCAASGGFNVFQGRRLQDNLIAFQALPYDPSSPPVLRAVNLRGPALEKAPTLQVLVYSSGRGVGVENAKLTLPELKPQPAGFSVQLPDGGPVGPNGLVVARSQLPLGAPNPPRVFQIKATELLANAFRRRNAGASAADPGFLSNQATPGSQYGTESGFFNPAFPQQYGLQNAGLAETGTRILMEFRDIPRGIIVWASVRDQSGKALLTYANPNGSGGFTRVAPFAAGYSELFVENGTATAVYEVVSADPVRAESLVFPFAVSALDGSPALGSATVRVRLGPTGPESAYPRFQSSPAPMPAFRISNTIETAPLTVVSAATLTAGAVSPDSLATLLGAGFTEAAPVSAASLQDVLGGLSVSLVDSTGAEFACKLSFASASQVNFLVPGAVARGPALIRVLRLGAVVATGQAQVEAVAPGLFSVNGESGGIANGMALRVSEQASPPAALARIEGDAWKQVPVPLAVPGEQVYLSLYATGVRHRSNLTNVQATIGGVAVPVLLAAPSPAGPGIDQVNLGPLPAGLFTGGGNQPLQLIVDGKPSNSLTVSFAN